jgi:hypothetical protein
MSLCGPLHLRSGGTCRPTNTPFGRPDSTLPTLAAIASATPEADQRKRRELAEQRKAASCGPPSGPEPGLTVRLPECVALSAGNLEPSQPDSRYTVSGAPYIFVKSATMNAENPPITRQSRDPRGITKMINTALSITTRDHKP